MHPSIQDIEKANKPAYDLRRTRVNEVTEENMFIEQDLKPRKSHERKNISKTLKKSFDEETSISHQAQKTSQYRDLEALVREILLIYRKRNGQNGDLGTGAKGSFPIVEEKLIAAIEALLNEKSRNVDRKKFHRSKEMFQMLTSNKEMFLKILQDQNSILLKEDRKSKSKSKGQESEEPLTHKHRKIHRRKSKSQEILPSYEKDRIVILKPGYSENRQSPGTRERAGKTVDSGWCSPNRDHFYMERFAKVPNGFKRVNEIKSENADDRISNIYVEAKKHLSEMLTSGDEDAESMKRSLTPLPRSLGRILSLREYNYYSPCTSPRGQPRPVVNKSQPAETVENPVRKAEVLEVVTREGDQESIKSSLYDKEHEKQPEECEPRDSATEGRPSESLEPDLPEKNEPSSPQNLHEHSLATKTEEHEIHPGKPSPTSILDPLFSDDDIIPARTISPPVDVTVQPRSIQFDELVSGSENQQIRITDSGDNEESEFEYVEAVLLSSDLNWSGFETRWLSSVQILDPVFIR
ncbi:uncharacterized protein LOC143601966 [Bidens hawaiensis]|uniref:uncharacterized protein LOC143601966 n=1 Tax=Bidens hawaiensis TaxID=980011 RepID=UPI004049DFC7